MKRRGLNSLNSPYQPFGLLLVSHSASVTLSYVYLIPSTYLTAMALCYACPCFVSFAVFCEGDKLKERTQSFPVFLLNIT